MTDDLVTCAACRNYRGNRCHDARNSGIWRTPVAEVGRDLAELPQRCPAFAPARAFQPTTTSETA